MTREQALHTLGLEADATDAEIERRWPRLSPRQAAGLNGSDHAIAAKIDEARDILRGKEGTRSRVRSPRTTRGGGMSHDDCSASRPSELAAGEALFAGPGSSSRACRACNSCPPADRTEIALPAAPTSASRA